MQTVQWLVLHHIHQNQVLTQAWHEHEFNLRAQRQDTDHQYRQSRCDQDSAEPGLRLLVALGERSDERHQRCAEQDKRQQQQERRSNNRQTKIRRHTQLFERHELQHDIERHQAQQQ